ncbi:MAG: response regulator [Alphaproteobacteria bacterium]|nr:response regulator [Alphaproteobacteria bacterium]
MAHDELKLLKVLLIDDEWFIRSTIRQVMSQIGIANVYEADSAADGMKETLRVLPSLVFCDIHMPGEDGLFYVNSLRKVPISGVAAIPVVMLTSDSTKDSVLMAKGLKVDGYLVKPVSLATLKKAIERALKITLP